MAEYPTPPVPDLNRRTADGQNSPPPSWIASIADLIQSRIALIQAEAKQATANNVRRVFMFIAAAMLAVFMWLLIITSAIGILHSHAGLPWYWGSLSIAGLHLLIILILIRCAKAPIPPAFQNTRSEFNKDREWLHNLQKTKSND